MLFCQIICGVISSEQHLPREQLEIQRVEQGYDQIIFRDTPLVSRSILGNVKQLPLLA